MTEGVPEEASPVGRSRSKTGRIIKGVVVPIVCVVALAYFVWSDRGRLESLGDADLLTILFIAFLVLVSHFLNSTEFWLLHRAQGAKTGIFENWMLFLSNQLGNFAPGQAGTVYRLRYMRQVHDVPYPTSLSVYGANFVATLAGASIAAFTGVVGFTLTGNDLPLVMVLLITGIFLLVVAMAVMPLPKFVSLNGKIGRAWRSFHEGFVQIRRDPVTAASVVMLEAAKYLVTAWRFAIVFAVVGLHESFWVFLVLAPAAGIAQFIAFTPGALGFRELLVTGAAALMGVALDNALLSATLDRAVLMLIAVGAGSVGMAVTYPRLRNSIKEAPDGVTDAVTDGSAAAAAPASGMPTSG
jgi:uncharacterized membrane protein YbhN (UPF0104 family)